MLRALPPPHPIVLILALPVMAASPRLQDEGYVGSAFCFSCHPEVAGRWQNTPHALAASRLGSENMNEQSYLGLGSEVTTRVKVRDDFQILFTQGAKLSVTFPPHDLIESERPVDAAKDCLGCHTTGYFVAERRYLEPGVGCEACHGPGRAHFASGGSKNTIVNPKLLTADRHRMVCGQCHSLGRDPSGEHPFPASQAGQPFQPGCDLALVFVDSQPLVTPQGGEYSTFVNSPPPYSEQLCTDCHDPHGNGNPSLLTDPTSALCRKCHANPLSGVDQIDEKSHWGADQHVCWNCHMYSHVH